MKSSNIPWILLCIVLGILLTLKLCESPVSDPVLSDTVYVDTSHHVDIKPPPPVFIPSPPTPPLIYVEWDDDTVAYYESLLKIYAQYLDSLFTMKIYCDTLKNDSVAFISLLDTVYNNSLRYRLLDFQNRMPTIINNIPQEKWSLCFGGGIGRSKNEFGLMPCMQVGVKKNVYQLGYDVIHKDLYITLLKKIK